jgi:hypothetical protein
MVNNIFYVYAYLRENGTPYYIGKGSKGRVFDRNTHTIKPPTDKNRIVFLETKLTNIGALALERRMIRWYGRIDIGTGILRNRTDGGDGSPGRQASEEEKLKRYKGENNPMYGKQQPDITIMNAGRTGINNPGLDKTVYEFVHKSGLTETCTRLGLVEKYSLSGLNFFQIKNGYSSLGWALKNFGFKYRNKGIKNPRADNTKYIFLKASVLECLSTHDMIGKYPNLSRASLRQLVTGKRNSHKGWIIVKEMN